jgi:N6-adenosine-specific RNA methylase IME4
MTKGMMPPPPPPPPPSIAAAVEEQVIKISDIKIGRRLRKKLTNIDSLTASIAKVGLLHPPVIDEGNNLIAGFRRIKAYESLGRSEIPFRRVNIKNVLQGEYDENVERADFKLEDIAEIYEEVKRSRVGHRPPADEEDNKDNNKVGKLPTFFPKGASDVVTGKIAGRSEQTVNKIVKLVSAVKDNPKLQGLVDQVDNGEKSIDRALQQATRAGDRDRPKPKPPEGHFDVLYVDPPWSYYYNMCGTPEDHYAVMTDEEIMQMQIPAGDNAVLFLWVPYPKSREAFDVIRAWGFEFKSKIIWVKDRIGTGHYVRAKHEELLICIKGDGLGVPAAEDRPPSVIFAPRTKQHSKKPEIFYSIIEKMYPGRTCIELFARGEPHNDDWKVWGLEAATTTTATEEEEEEEEANSG